MQYLQSCPPEQGAIGTAPYLPDSAVIQASGSDITPKFYAVSLLAS